jgi:response regulator RpfG family c-di-GMP phosphodiesterase
MSVSILAVDDEVDVADLFRQHFRREVQQGQYVLHFARSGEDALDKLARGIEPQLIVILSDINMPGMDELALLRECHEPTLTYSTGTASGCPFSEIRKSITLAGAVVLGFRIVCTLLSGFEPKSPTFIMCS